MYGLWYVFFGFLALAAAGGICALVWRLTEVDNWLLYLGISIAIIGGVISFILLWFCIFCPMGTAEEVARYMEMYPIYISQVELLNKNPNSLAAFSQNSELINDVIDYNKWLAFVKSNQRTYGCFSRYFNVDLSQLEFIKLS